MKKKVIAIGLACLTAGTGLTGCAGNNSQPESGTAAETTAAETTAVSEATTEAATLEKITETTTQAPSVSEETTNKLYGEIIDIYYMVQQKCDDIIYNIPEDVQQRLPKGGLWDYFKDSIDLMGTDYYYTIHDLDNNGVKELVIFIGDSPNAIYTISDDEVVPLAFGAYRHMLKISDDGKIYLLSHGGHQDYQFSKFGFSEDGNSLLPIYYKGIDGNNPDGSLIYYSYPSIAGESFFNFELGDMKEISEAEFKSTEDEYNSVVCTFERIPVQSFSSENETTTAKVADTAAGTHPEDEVFMVYLRELSGNANRKDDYSKFAIADFDADGKNELALENNNSGERGLEIIDEEDLSLQYDAYTYIYDRNFELLTFLDNGIAYAKNDMAVDFDDYDDKEYYLINPEWLQKLNYDLSIQNTLLERKMSYFEENGSVYKNFECDGVNINTQGYKNANEIIPKDQCEQELQWLNSGNIMDIDIKDFSQI